MAGETSTGTHAQVYTHSRMCAHDVENVLWLCFRFKVLCVSFFLLPSLFSFSLFVVFLSFEEGLPGCNGCALYKKKLVGGCVDAAQQLVEVGNRVEMGKSLKPPPQKNNCAPHVAEKNILRLVRFFGQAHFLCGSSGAVNSFAACPLLSPSNVLNAEYILSLIVFASSAVRQLCF